jgi:hypothetical protein
VVLSVSRSAQRRRRIARHGIEPGRLAWLAASAERMVIAHELFLAHPEANEGALSLMLEARLVGRKRRRIDMLRASTREKNVFANGEKMNTRRD